MKLVGICVIFLLVLACNVVTGFHLPLRVSTASLRRPPLNSLLRRVSRTNSISRMYTSLPHFDQHLLSNSQSLNHTVFCNVELNCVNLEAIGFDMDYTLAQYKESFDMLAFEGAKQKLVHNLQYPAEILQLSYGGHEKFRRGLIIDKKRGNIIKVDRHKYVRKVFHGSKEYSTEERKAIYGKDVATFSEAHYSNIDTIFLLVDAVLFAYLVDYKESHPELFAHKSYEDIYRDIRHCVDLSHRDGVIKDTVMQDPAKYIIYDEGVVPMLQQWRQAHKKVFLLTNSMWEYTNAVMKYLVHGRGDNLDIHSWEDLFDVVIVGGNKPAFLRENYLSIFKVDQGGNLHNIEDKASISRDSIQQEHGHKVYQGGHWQDLHKMLNISFGDRILYVGDHMFADILRSKRTLGWRTCLIIPELDHELAVAKTEEVLFREVLKLRRLQYDLDEYIDALRLKVKQGLQIEELQTQIRQAEEKAEEIKSQVRIATETYNAKFNPFWGQLFKAGHQDSRFAKQVMDYACLYTSKASNLGLVSPNRPFRPVQDFMPHDQILFDLDVATSLSS